MERYWRGKHERFGKIYTLCNPCYIWNTNWDFLSTMDWRSWMTTWKHCERMIAKLLGGERTGCNGESRRDVEHPRWSVEVKHRKSLPEWLHSAMRQAELEAEHRVPIVVLHEKGLTYEKSYVIIRMDDFITETEGGDWEIPTGKEVTD